MCYNSYLMNAEISKPTVLIIEDEVSLRRLYKAIISGSKFEAVIVSTGVEGLTYFKANKDTTHLVILDRDLPGVLGEVVAERMRQISGKADDPYILMISGRADHLSIVNLRLSGINDLLAKPVRFEDVLGKLNEARQRFLSPRV